MEVHTTDLMKQFSSKKAENGRNFFPISKHNHMSFAQDHVDLL